jgi:two-component system sensor histidine kinase PilS (NtrC family)
VLATGVLAFAALCRLRRPAWIVGALLALDVGLVSGLIHFSGGMDSVFTPLYVLVVLSAAGALDRRGAYTTAALAAIAFGAVIGAEGLGLLTSYGEAEETALPVVVLHWAVHAAAMLLVALLASVLLRDLRRTDEDLAKSRLDLGRLRRLHERTVGSLLSGLLTTDREGRVTSFNPEAERITGRDAASVIGLSLDEVLPGARARVLAASEDPSGIRLRARMPFRNPRGETLHLGLSGSILRELDGSPGGHVVIFQDVTDVVRMELELRRSERLAAVGQLSAAIAHEIRNPLAAISGSIQMLHATASPAGDDESRRLMEIVLRETRRLNALITDFLQYARPGPAKLERVALGELAEEIVKMLENARASGVEIRCDVPAELAVRGDAGQIRQVLWNLCRNALQAMPEGGALEISARGDTASAAQASDEEGRNARDEGEGAIEIVVRDAGVGMPPEVLERIFDPFFTTKTEGTGLGLATVHRIVEAHGGSLRVESAPGLGSTFRVRLPRAGEQA